MKSILISLPENRFGYGQLFVTDNDQSGVVCFGPVAADGKADNLAAAAAGNPTRDPAKKMGDTPLGTYIGRIGREQSSEANIRSYGNVDVTGTIPVIWLTPLRGDGTGQASQTSQAWRRQEAEGIGVDMGLAIHTGSLNDLGGLRPTHGCVRLFQSDFTALMAQMNGLQSFTVTIEQKA